MADADDQRLQAIGSGPRIAVVTCTDSWAAQMTERLEAEGYVAAVAGCDAAADLVGTCHLAIVDTAMAGCPASRVCAAMRERSALPILAVSPPDARSNEIVGVYEAGADQVVVATVGPKELVARVRALLRRTPPQELDDEAPLELGSIRVDPPARAIVLSGVKVDLTVDDLAIVLALVRRPGRVVRRVELAERVPGCHPGHALDSLIRQLRSKLEAVEGWRRIETVRGVGFRFADDAERVVPGLPPDLPVADVACA